jgi:hypothetical protein
MAQVTLDRAIALLSSDKVKERSDGLGGMENDLSEILDAKADISRPEAHPSAKQEESDIVRRISVSTFCNTKILITYFTVLGIL